MRLKLVFCDTLSNFVHCIFCCSTANGWNGCVDSQYDVGCKNVVFTLFIISNFIDLEGGRYFFNAVKEGDSILWACDDENECHLWVMALYRATGQAHKPTPLTSNTPKTAGLCKTQAGK